MLIVDIKCAGHIAQATESNAAKDLIGRIACCRQWTGRRPALQFELPLLRIRGIEINVNAGQIIAIVVGQSGDKLQLCANSQRRNVNLNEPVGDAQSGAGDQYTVGIEQLNTARPYRGLALVILKAASLLTPIVGSGGAVLPKNCQLESIVNVRWIS